MSDDSPSWWFTGIRLTHMIVGVVVALLGVGTGFGTWAVTQAWAVARSVQSNQFEISRTHDRITEVQSDIVALTGNIGQLADAVKTLVERIHLNEVRVVERTADRWTAQQAAEANAVLHKRIDDIRDRVTRLEKP